MDIATLIAVLGWGALVGIVFSAIGAAGGILTSFGLITLFAVTLLGESQRQTIISSHSGYYITHALHRARSIMPAESMSIILPV